MRKAMLLLALAALMAPGTAAAASIELDGQAVTLAGRGFVRGELTAAEDARPVLIRAKAGYVKVLDLGGDLEVRCQGRGKAATRQNDEGQTVFLCAGRGGRMAISGSHFKLNGFAMRMQIRIPDGYTGTLGGNVHEWTAADEAGSEAQPAAAERQQPTRDKPKGDKPKGDKPKGDKPAGDKPAGDKPAAERSAAAPAALPQAGA